MLHRWPRIVALVGLCTFLVSMAVVSRAQESPAPRVWAITADTQTPFTLQFTVVFSEAVTGVDTTDFSTSGDDQFAAITNVSASDTTSNTHIVDVTVTGPSAQLALALFDNDSIVNAAGIPLGGIGASNGNAVSDIVTIEPPVTHAYTTPLRTGLDAPLSIEHQVGWFTSIALTTANVPVISYLDETNSDLKLAVCHDAACANPTISTLDSTGWVGANTSIALTTANVPVISYLDETNANLKLAVCNNPACTSPTISTIDSTGDVGWFTSIALTTANVPVISYLDDTNGLKLAVCNDVACSSPTISTLDSTGYVGWYTSIALTTANVPVISYLDVTNRDLKLAVCNNPACTSPTISTIDSTGNVGAYTSIALTTANVPVISYHDITNEDLKLAVCNDVACSSPTISTLDSTGNVGRHLSIALTTANVPVISYYDATNYRLKFRYEPVIIDDGQPNSFNTSTPTANQRITATTTTLSWQASTHADSYEYCYATAMDTCTTWLSTGIATSATLTGLAHNTTYYWQVRATNASGTTRSNSTAFSQFTVTLPPVSFAKSLPANNAKNQKTSVTLSWAASTRATSYEYCIALSTGACTNWKSTGTARTATVTDLAKNKSYYWQVRAKNAGSTTLSNTTFWKFTTAP